MLDEIVRWASARDDIRAIVMTGSRARGDGRVDTWSDSDVELFTTDPDRYASGDWTADIAPVWVRLALPRDDDARYRMFLTVFEGGTKVDFAIAPLDILREFGERGRLSDVYERGYVVLLDRDGLAAALPEPRRVPPRWPLPSEAEFQAAVEEFWFEASHIPKYIARGEGWVVKFRDWTMKKRLLEMAGWRALAEDPSADIWDIGAHLRDWAGPDLEARLLSTFAHADPTDSRRALLAETELFRDLTAFTATRLGFAYPNQAQTGISAYLGSVLPPD